MIGKISILGSNHLSSKCKVKVNLKGAVILEQKEDDD